MFVNDDGAQWALEADVYKVLYATLNGNENTNLLENTYCLIMWTL